MKNDKLDKIRGSLIGGAVGDALGYAVEFMLYKEIVGKFGKDGITSYYLVKNKALISDDTQMTLFTAAGLLDCYTENTINGTNKSPIDDIYDSYIDWYNGQMSSDSLFAKPKFYNWLSSVSEMNSRRAPGNTCFNALRSGDCGTINEPINNSKGCGGVMRVAPVALLYDNEVQLDCAMKIAAEASAITHGHKMGYIPSAVMVYIIQRVMNSSELTVEKFDPFLFEGIVKNACRAADKLYHCSEMHDFTTLMRCACEYASNDKSDVENIESLGGGWVGDEALAIAVYCVAKYGNDFDKVMIAAVNHSGDSDSTGSIAGNIAGAFVGYSNISDKWKENLECRDVILEVADDLCTKYSDSADWKRKYCINK